MAAAGGVGTSAARWKGAGGGETCTRGATIGGGVTGGVGSGGVGIGGVGLSSVGGFGVGGVGAGGLGVGLFDGGVGGGGEATKPPIAGAAAVLKGEGGGLGDGGLGGGGGAAAGAAPDPAGPPDGPPALKGVKWKGAPGGGAKLSSDGLVGASAFSTISASSNWAWAEPNTAKDSTDSASPPMKPAPTSWAIRLLWPPKIRSPP